MKENKRQANFELLRITAMFMVVSMHYLIKGEVAVSMAENDTAVNYFAWMLESVFIVAVNVYVLISGYFLVTAEWRFAKLIRLLGQILFYSMGVPVVCLIFGIGNVRQWSIYDWATAVFPLQMEHYWFATAYVVLYLLAPVLAAAVKRMEKEQLQITIGILIAFFSLGKSILPILIPTDRYGYDFGWFLCLFLIAAYIRLYSIPFWNNAKRAFGMYGILTAMIFLWSAFLGWLTRTKGLPLSYAMDMVHCYNHILVLGASVALFCGIRQLKLKEGFFSRLVCKMAPYTFGVYLLHENTALRLLWQGWFGVDKVRNSFWFLPHMFVTVCIVFGIGIAVDFFRDCCFKRIQRGISALTRGKMTTDIAAIRHRTKQQKE